MKAKKRGKGCICCDVGEHRKFGERVSDYYGVSGSLFPCIKSKSYCCVLDYYERECEIFYCPWCGRKLMGYNNKDSKAHYKLMKKNNYFTEK